LRLICVPQDLLPHTPTSFTEFDKASSSRQLAMTDSGRCAGEYQLSAFPILAATV
jgi:hypothetical protein